MGNKNSKQEHVNEEPNTNAENGAQEDQHPSQFAPLDEAATPSTSNPIPHPTDGSSVTMSTASLDSALTPSRASSHGTHRVKDGNKSNESPQFSFMGNVHNAMFSGHFGGPIGDDGFFEGTFTGRLHGSFVGNVNGVSNVARVEANRLIAKADCRLSSAQPRSVNDNLGAIDQSVSGSSAESNANSDNEAINNDSGLSDQPERRRSLRVAEKEAQSSAIKRAQQQQLPSIMAPDLKRMRRTDGNGNAALNEPPDQINWRRVISLKCIDRNCPETFDNFADLYSHMEDKHNLLRYLCFAVDCEYGFDSFYDLRDHAATCRQTTSKYECRLCPDTQFSSQKEAACHWEGHLTGLFECTLCSCYFEMINLTCAQNHLNNSKYQCNTSNVCGHVAHSWSQLTYHRGNNHTSREKTLRCCNGECGKLRCCSFNQSSMIEHLQSQHKALGKIKSMLSANTVVLTKESLDLKVKEITKKRPSSSSAAFDPFIHAGPSTSGTAPMRPSLRTQESEDSEEEDD